ncbi:MAG: SMC-Scp complex subunit ScpB [Gammaproteobacteria bacterium]|nr:SMC-Scp complex subunit ScpB [Gammaproteobacteria bacterium]
MQLKSIIEGALLAAGRALTLAEIADLFDAESRPGDAELGTALEELRADCAGRALELREVASGYRLQVRQEFAPWIARLWDEKPARYSRALLETLSLIAYRQPITRGDIEEIRGVAVNPNIIRTLQEREWVRVVGQRDVPGRPELFATTRQFLDHFGLSGLDQLPTLAEIKDFEQVSPVLELAIDVQSAPAEDVLAGSDGAVEADTAAIARFDVEPEADMDSAEQEFGAGTGDEPEPSAAPEADADPDHSVASNAFRDERS